MNYTIKKCDKKNITAIDRRFIVQAAEQMNILYGTNYDWSQIDFKKFLIEDYLIVCYYNEKPIGFLAASFYESFFDPSVKILQQNLLYALPKTRGAYLLLKEFVDFGRANANHVITMIAKHTNIKSRSLEKLGFKQMEVLYRLEG